MSYLKQTTKMGTWRIVAIRKKQRGNQEDGRKKGLVPPLWAKACARQSRAYKHHPRYGDWCRICNGDKIKWKTS